MVSEAEPEYSTARETHPRTGLFGPDGSGGYRFWWTSYTHAWIDENGAWQTGILRPGADCD